MMKSIRSILMQDKERYKIPKRVQDVIPIRKVWTDGIFMVGNRFSKTWKFTDINFLVASREDKEAMFLDYSDLLNGLDSGATTKITINNRKMQRSDFENSILMPMRGDGRDNLRQEYNKMLLEKALNGNGILQEKYITVTVSKRSIEEARSYFARMEAELIQRLAALGSRCTPLEAADKLKVLHDFYRSGEESSYVFNVREAARRGHDFKDFICPDYI